MLMTWWKQGRESLYSTFSRECTVRVKKFFENVSVFDKVMRKTQRLSFSTTVYT